jgi:predicted DsbA family dithiol-disulfide isomerase
MTTNDADDRLVIDVWSDVVCPFCYLGHGELAAAVRQFEPGADVRYHSFQLNPAFPADVAELADDYVVREYGVPAAQFKASHDQITQRGAGLGLDYRFEKALMVNTRTAHRAIHAADAAGAGPAMTERLFKAEFTDGLDLSRVDVLADLAAEVGLDRTGVQDALESGGFEAEVDADLEAARQLGITGVPFFVFDQRLAVSGAQPGATFRQALQQAWESRAAADAR